MTDEAARRSRSSLSSAFGPTIRAALDDPDVLEIMVNPDGRIWLDTLSEGRAWTGNEMSGADAERLVRLLAHSGQKVIGRDEPRLSGVLPEQGHRFQASTPPVVKRPTLAIRKRAGRIFTLDDYVASGCLTVDQKAFFEAALRQRMNLIIAGGAGSGKTTFANALLAHPSMCQDRVIMIEDTPELNCAAADLVTLCTSTSPSVTIGDLVRDTLRLRPDRIVVGEVRDGAALELLKAWNTGHPGGLATIHANSAFDVLMRLEDLIAEVAAAPSRALIGCAVDAIVFLRRTPSGRLAEEILLVDGYDQGSYKLRRE